jgi:hypothetical protein
LLVVLPGDSQLESDIRGSTPRASISVVHNRVRRDAIHSGLKLKVSILICASRPSANDHEQVQVDDQPVNCSADMAVTVEIKTGTRRIIMCSLAAGEVLAR